MILKLNEPQNNLQLIQIDEGFVVVNLVTKLIHKDWHLEKGLIINQFPDYLTDLDDCKKIIFASQSLNLEGVKVIEEDNKDKELALKTFRNIYNTEFINIPKHHELLSIITKAQQAKENTYTEEQLRESFRLGNIQSRKPFSQLKEYFNTYIESLNQPKVEITFDENNQPLTAKLI